MSPETLGYAFALTAAAAWGFVVIAVRAARAPGALGVAVSMPAGLAVLVPLALVLRGAHPDLGVLWSRAGLLVAASGLLQFPVATTCYYEAIRSADVSTIAPLKEVKVVFTVLLVAALGLEAVGAIHAAACAVSVLGALILIGRSQRADAGRAGAARESGDVPQPNPLPEGEGDGMEGGGGGEEAQAPGPDDRARLRRGVLMALGAAAGWAVGDVLMGQAVRDVDAVLATPAALAVGLVAYYAWMAARGRLRAALSLPRRERLLFAAHGVVSFGLGYGALFASMQYIGVARPAIVTNAWPLIAALVGFVLYRERLTVRKCVGGGLLIASVYLAMLP